MEDCTFVPESVCRCCAKTLNNSKINLKSQVLELYTWCSRTPIKPDDSLPQQICPSCYLILIDFKRFQKMCVDSYYRFINQSKYVVAAEENKFEITIKKENDDDIKIKNELIDDNLPAQIECKNNEKEEAKESVSPSKSNEEGEAVVEQEYEILSGKSLLDLIIPEETEAPYNCNDCQIKSWNKILYDSHLASHISSSKSFICAECPAEFSNEESYENHKNCHCTNKDQEICKLRVMKPIWFLCNEKGCNQKYKSLKLLKEHRSTHSFPEPPRKKHKKITPLMCKLCRNVFESIADFNLHREVHNDAN